MNAFITTKFENGNIKLPKNLEIKNGSKLFINIADNDLELNDIINRLYVNEIDEHLEELDRIYNKNNLVF